MNATSRSDAATDAPALTGEWLKMAPPLRRCLWYVCISFLGLSCLVFWIQSEVLERPLKSSLGAAFVMLLMAFAAAVTLRWRLHVGIDGITRRRFFWRDHWAWRDFSSGRLQKPEGCSAAFIDPARPWWRRRLRVDFLSNSDGSGLMELINSTYVSPPAAELPEEVTITTAWQKWRFCPQGISLKRRSKRWEYAWNDVQWLAIMRADEKRRDFNHLRLELPGRELELKYVSHQGGRSPTWRGATAEVVGETLRKYVDPSRVEVLVPGTRPRRLEDVQKEYEKLQGRRRELIRAFALMGPLLLAAIVWLGVSCGWMSALIAAFGYGSMLVAVGWARLRRTSAQLLEWEAWLEEMRRGEDQI